MTLYLINLTDSEAEVIKSLRTISGPKWANGFTDPSGGPNYLTRNEARKFAEEANKDSILFSGTRLEHNLYTKLESLLEDIEMDIYGQER